MRKTIKPKSIIFMLAFVFLFVFFKVAVNAYSQSGITSLNVESGNLQITVSGTTEDDLTAVSISVYKSDGLTLVKMKTSSVSDDNKFSEIIPLEKGTYVVKVANYDGGEVVSKENVIVNGDSTEDIEDETERQKSETKNQKSNPVINKESHKKATVPSAKSLESPKTSDNIALLVTLLATCSLGSLAAINFRKNKK